MVFFFISAPDAPPENFHVGVISSQSLQLLWSPPSVSKHNGVIRRYLVNATEVETGLVLRRNVKDPYVVLSDLHPYYQYVCTVAAVTIDVGPVAMTTTRTLEDGELQNELTVKIEISENSCSKYELPFLSEFVNVQFYIPSETHTVEIFCVDCMVIFML